MAERVLDADFHDALLQAAIQFNAEKEPGAMMVAVRTGGGDVDWRCFPEPPFYRHTDFDSD